ncbi:GTP 3',8-cyclase MoaA [Helicobacter sp. MIT 99-5507]|uniref:GTP 3',8-cyclase MoaA n=1 Tax=Helicobacter sp. MIT 99-5507 TaxID=152489 RepID=UPI000E1EFDC7|nr:GTP 3',8-cyclase MoaA [Helicobacter sp. MIT 99-5507]RDU58081.1 GTP 3',8-cyclase MoaA [Helicobacter sp. MIT 99-5507]
MLIDSFGRVIDYIRISVTKNCNFRCKYCMPNTPDEIAEDLIPLDKMLEFLKIAMDYGVKKIRITGGEPLLRKDLSSFVKGIYDYKNDIEVALTTNGYFLKKYAKELKDSGLKRINVSLDSLKKEKIELISKKDALDFVLEGLQEAKAVNLKIKLNMVPLKGINDDEIVPMLEFANKENFLLRYIEYMENDFASNRIKGLKSFEILENIKKKYNISMIQKEAFGPAKLYKLDNTDNVFGIIAPHNDEFCASCNRIRITAEGIICPCLYFQDAIDVSQAIRNDDKKAMKEALLSAIKNKPEKNKWGEGETSTRAFYHTGG